MTAPATKGRGGWQEWETTKGGLVPPDGSDQPPTGAKAPQKGARGERSTANGGAYEQMIRLNPTTMLGARARAYATRKQGSPKLKAVAGGAGRAQRSRAPASDTAPASDAIATGAGAGADAGRRGGGERAPTSGARSTAPQVTIWEPVGFPMMRVKSNLSPKGNLLGLYLLNTMDVRHGKCLTAQVVGLSATWAGRLLQTMGRVMAMHGARRQEGQGEPSGAEPQRLTPPQRLAR